MGKKDIPEPVFTVQAKQSVSLVFPKSQYRPSSFGFGDMLDFIKELSADEALAISAALKTAAAEIL